MGSPGLSTSTRRMGHHGAEDGNERRDFIQSIERGFAVLLAFDAERPSRSSLRSPRRTGLPDLAVRRILLTLQRLGLCREPR